MKSGKERRTLKRWKVAVLVRCSIPKVSKDTLEMEMWAKDVNAKGMKLEWTRGLGVSQIPVKGQVNHSHPIRFEDIKFSKGAKIMVQDLFYDDDGSPFMEGKILWARHSDSAESWALGIEFVKGGGHSKELLGAFKDFLNIVKSPTAAMAKATRKR